MLEVWFYSLVSIIIISLISLIAIFFLFIRLSLLKKIILCSVSFSTGALIGSAFIHLIPEAIEKFGFSIKLSLFLILGIIVFFILEKIICWRHCHIPTSKTHPHPLVYMNLIGDGLHNFIDGMIIAGSFITSFPIGITTTLAVISHEIPQEISDFGVLIHGGLTRTKALLLNFASSLSAILGAIITFIAYSYVENLISFLLPFTAGGFIYIAGSDLIPEMHKETTISKSVIQLVFIILGIVMMLLI